MSSIIFKNNRSNTLQAFWVGAGSLTSFCFVFISAAILSRYFNKDDYGTYRQVLYVYNTLLVVFSLGLPSAFSYFLSRVSMEQGKSLVKKITRLFYLMGGLCSVLLFLCSPFIARILNNPDLEMAMKIFSPVPLLMLPTMGIDSIYATYRKTYVSAIYMVITRVFMLCCIALPVMFLDGTYITAVIGFVVASFLTFVVAIFLKNRPFIGYVKQKCEYSYKQILSYTLPLMYAGFFGIVTASAGQFFVSRYFGSAIFAEFANGSLEIPFVGMIIGACSAVLSPLFSKHVYNSCNPQAEILPIWRNSIAKSVQLIYPMIVFCWFFADNIMTLSFGEMYENSAIHFRIKLIANFFTLAVYAPLFFAIGKTKLYANILLYEALILIPLLYISVLMFHSPYIITAVLVVCQIGRVFAFFYFTAKYLKVSILKLFPLELSYKIVFPSIIILFVIRYFMNLDSLVLQLIIGAITYVILFFFWTRLIKLDYSSIIKPLLYKK